jgi:hypothetical protein
MRSVTFFLVVVSLSAITQAQILKHGASPEEVQKLNSQFEYHQTRIYPQQEVGWKPVFEAADYKYVLFSSEAGFSEAENLRYKIAENLPEDVKLVLLVNKNQAEAYKKIYSKYISLDRLI